MFDNFSMSLVLGGHAEYAWMHTHLCVCMCVCMQMCVYAYVGV